MQKLVIFLLFQKIINHFFVKTLLKIVLKIIRILCVEDDEIKIQKFSLGDYSWKKDEFKINIICLNKTNNLYT